MLSYTEPKTWWKPVILQESSLALIEPVDDWDKGINGSWVWRRIFNSYSVALIRSASSSTVSWAQPICLISLKRPWLFRSIWQQIEFLELILLIYTPSILILIHY